MRKLFVLCCCIVGIFVSSEGAQKRELTHIFDKKYGFSRKLMNDNESEKKFYVDQDPAKGLLRSTTMAKFPSKSHLNLLSEFHQMHDRWVNPDPKLRPLRDPEGKEIPHFILTSFRKKGLKDEIWRLLYLVNPLGESREEYDEDIQLKILKGELDPPPAKEVTNEKITQLIDEDNDFELIYRLKFEQLNAMTSEAANLLEFLKKASPENPEHIKVVNEIVARLKYSRAGTLGATLIEKIGEITAEPTAEISEIKIPGVNSLENAIKVLRSRRAGIQVPQLNPSDYDMFLKFYQSVPSSIAALSGVKIEVNVTKQTIVKTGPGHSGDIHISEKSSCTIV